MTARYAVIASAITAAVAAVMVAGLALFSSDLGLSLPEGLEHAAIQQYQQQSAQDGVGVHAAGVWDDCAVLDMSDGKSLIMVSTGEGWRIGRMSQETADGYFDTDDIASREICLSAAGDTPL